MKRLDKPIDAHRPVSGKEAVWTTIIYKGVTYNLQCYVDNVALENSCAELLEQSNGFTTTDKKGNLLIRLQRRP